MKLGSLFAAVVGLSVGALPAQAQKSADTIRIVERNAVTNIDPYYNQLRAGLVLSHQGWDGLVYRDPETFQPKPLLATSWKIVDDTTIEFTLRQGVKFHNGDAFTADDVVYTFNTVSAPDSKVSTPSNSNWMERAEKIDDFTVRIKLKKPTPAALEYFAMVLPIYPKAYREKVGPEGYSKAPVGAGPYKITRVDAGHVNFERFDGYWNGSPRGKPAIGKLAVRFVPDAATEMTELLAGRADFIWGFNPDQFDGVNKMPNLRATRQESMRVGFLRMDLAGTNDALKPLTNQKVRQAIFHAIDRQQIADKLITGGSRVPPAPCFPTQFGCDADAAVKYPYDPAKAKQLLAEAGYPNGFETEIVTYILPQWSASIQAYLAAVGIKAKLTQLQVQALIQRCAIVGECPLDLGSWGSYSINDVSAILPVFLGGGKDDHARDPETAKLIEAGGTTMDPAKRKAAYSAAIKLAMEKAYWVPLHTYVTTYGFAKNLDMNTQADEMPRFWLAKWK
ncbi:MAG: ABC transporter substrate-binding protein [Acetobacteraceae bacterium]